FSPHSTMYRPFTDVPMSQSLRANSQVPPLFQSMMAPNQMMQPPQPIRQMNNDYQSHMASMFPQVIQAPTTFQPMPTPPQMVPSGHQTPLIPHMPFSQPSLFPSVPSLIAPRSYPPLPLISYRNPVSIPPPPPPPLPPPPSPTPSLLSSALPSPLNSAYATPSSSPLPHFFEMSLCVTSKELNSHHVDNKRKSSPIELMPQSVRCF
ncbi:hypothetical protein PENTCL1PPCAC_10143, partial [Pristionchus entomophagus]